ncbi:SH3 domain-containing protein [Pseudodesulfovibrio cashew]|uniref:SH3 domain-containing protein n=1 Tax=Pseudodesulfovibrio cashew TaxID=2678688 RepID=A0A6I6JK16_9BACT|nr:SH3 domain-containing protein [Pseudodesulfovibrio cashew]QGY40693.1 SH3 domain-containing protein [Pseudodesulfovibrio cashew]
MQKVLSILFAALVAVLVTAPSALAFGEIRYPDRPLNLRKSRSPRSEWVGALHPGQKVRVAFLRDGWVAVFEPDETRATEAAAVGFSNIKYLKKSRTRVEPKPWGETMVTTRKLNVRSQPSTRGRKLMTLDAGVRVVVDFPEDDWFRLFPPDATIRSRMGGYGFSSSKYLEPAPAEPVAAPALKPVAQVEPEPAPEPVSKPVAEPVRPAPAAKADVSKPFSASWGKVLTLKRKVNLMSGRTTSSRLVRVLEPGETVRADFPENGWYAVFQENEPLRRKERALGYALQSLLEGGPDVEEPAPAPTRSTAPSAKPVDPAVDRTPSPDRGQTTLVIDRSKFKQGKRPDPTPNKTAHGYQYRLLEKSETRQYGETWITLKVFLATKKLPGIEGLEDFAATLWREHKRPAKNLAVLIYLPGMDTDDLSYGVIKFDEQKRIESWVRKTTLIGTDFL